MAEALVGPRCVQIASKRKQNPLLKLACICTICKVHCNIADAYRDVALAKECIRNARKDTCWEEVWKRIEKFGTARCQRHHGETLH